MAVPKKPKGAKSDKEWRDMIRLTVNELRADPKSGKKTKALRQLAHREDKAWSVLERTLPCEPTDLIAHVEAESPEAVAKFALAYSPRVR